MFSSKKQANGIFAQLFQNEQIMTEIFYYSGTGFTLKAAKILQKELHDKVILKPIVGLMNSGCTISNAEKVGLMMPLHAFGMPSAYRRFLDTFQFPNAKYIFVLVTCGGAPAKVYNEINKHLKHQNKKLNAFRYAVAPNTFDVVLNIGSSKKVKDARLHFNEDVKNFATIINRNENSIELMYRNYFGDYFLFPVMRMLNRKTAYFNLQNDFYVDNKCIGCGQCEKMCLSGKIKINDKKPEWQSNVSCQYCLACLNLCPQQAIQVRKTKTPKIDRIFCPGTVYKDIAAQKEVNSSGRSSLPTAKG